MDRVETVRAGRTLTVGVLITLLAAACSSEPSEPGDVLEAWVEPANTGDVEAAQAFLASNDIPWLGIGDSPHAYTAGTGPYEADNFFIECTSDHTLGRCDIWWRDRWIDAIPELDPALDGGEPLLRVTAEVEDGKIVAFREWVFHPAVVSAFGQHLDWLELSDQEAFAASCGADPASTECSQLLVDSVGMWVADR